LTDFAAITLVRLEGGRSFAGNGGGEIYAFDTGGAVFVLPMIGMEPEAATKVADDFLEFARSFQRAVSSGK